MRTIQEMSGRGVQAGKPAIQQVGNLRYGAGNLRYGMMLAVALCVSAATALAQPTKALKDEPKAPSVGADTYFLATTGSVMNTALVPVQALSNVPLGRITLTNAAAGSNVLLYASNNVAVTQSANTNDVYASGAGTPAVNSHYVLKTTVSTGTLIVYTNTTGIDGFMWDVGNIHFGSDTYLITNTAGVNLYGGEGLWLDGVTPFSGVAGAWEDLNAGNQSPTFVTYGTNFTTNVVMSLELAGAAVPVTALDTNLYVNGKTGDDTSARLGRKDFPYKTVTAGLKALKAWQILFVADGTYNETSTVVALSTTLPVGAKIIGAGERRTLIVGRATESTLTLMNSNVISDLALMNTWIYVGTGLLAGQVATNTLVKRVEATAPGDVWFGVAHWEAHIEDCHFDGNSDKIADAADTAPDAFTNSTIHVKDTTITGGGGSDGFGFRRSRQPFHFANVHVDVTGVRAELGNENISYGSLIQSNTWAAAALKIAAMIPGDTLDVSSNGVRIGIAKGPAGVLSTNRLYP